MSGRTKCHTDLYHSLQQGMREGHGIENSRHDYFSLIDLRNNLIK